MTIAIIGGGASGMAAALAAAENENNQVILLERQARVGKKLQATGMVRLATASPLLPSIAMICPFETDSTYPIWSEYPSFG